MPSFRKFGIIAAAAVSTISLIDVANGDNIMPYVKTDGGIPNQEAPVANSMRDTDAIHRVLLDFKSSDAASVELPFETEVQKLMDILVNHLYGKPEIFLRELMSNASDALKKARFRSLTEPEVLKDNPELEIKVHVDPELHTLTLRDTGIGMTKDELVRNLGSIGKSGTSEVLRRLKELDQDSSDFIGKFGVGFYSAFLVADTVLVTSKSPESETQYVWTSDGSGKYRIFEDTRGESAKLGRGTEITLVLKEKFRKQFEDINYVEGIIKKFSRFVEYPIYLLKSVERQIPQGGTGERKEEDGDNGQNTSGETTREQETSNVKVEDELQPDAAAEKANTTHVKEFVHINPEKPIWLRNADEITLDEYNSFYKSVYLDDKDPLLHIHFKAEGEFNFQAILFIPAKAPSLAEFRKLESSIMLYSRRVMIMDEIPDFLPIPFIFLKGLVSSDELKLNVSRETIQGSRDLKIAKKRIISKTIKALQTLAAEDPLKYSTLFREYARFIKGAYFSDEGISESQRESVKDLLWFPTSRTVNDAPIQPLLNSIDDSSVGLVSFKTYVERMKSGQKHIFYLTGSSLDEIRRSPVLEGVLSRGFEVFYMADPTDESVMQTLTQYGDYKLKDVGKGDILFDQEDEVDDETKVAIQKEKEEHATLEERFRPLKVWLERILSSSSDKTVISRRLTNTSSTVVASDHGLSPNMERLLQLRAAASGEEDQMQRVIMQMRLTDKKTFEINPHHPIIQSLLQRVEQLDTQRSILKDTKKRLYGEGRNVDETKQETQKSEEQGPEDPEDAVDKTEAKDDELESDASQDSISSGAYSSPDEREGEGGFKAPSTREEYEVAKQAFITREKSLAQVARLMFENAMQRSGYDVRDRLKFSERIEAVVRAALGVGDEARVGDLKIRVSKDKEVQGGKGGNGDPSTGADERSSPGDGIHQDL